MLITRVLNCSFGDMLVRVLNCRFGELQFKTRVININCDLLHMHLSRPFRHWFPEVIAISIIRS